MNRTVRGRPATWLAAGLLVIAGLSTVLLIKANAVHQEERELRYFWSRHVWQSAFDALSATCGCGLLTYHIDEDYDERGRWILALTGLTGALWFLACAAGAARHVAPPRAPDAETDLRRLPRTRYILLAFAGLSVLSVVAFSAAHWWQAGMGAPLASLQAAGADGVAAAATLGWERADVGWLPVAVGWLASLGWLVWLLPFGALRSTGWLPTALRFLVADIVIVVFCAGLLTVLEGPRGVSSERNIAARSAERVERVAPAERVEWSLRQAAAASGLGATVQTPDETPVSDAGRTVLAALVLLGGLGGGVGGGVKLMLFWFTLVGVGVGLAPRRNEAEVARRIGLGGRAALILATYVGFALLIAFGLLLIEQLTASPWTPRPALSGALLDAASAVGGASLTGGLTEAVTSRNLVQGLGLGFDLYQLGMAWLMFAMFVGRVLPVWLITRLMRDVLRTPAAIA